MSVGLNSRTLNYKNFHSLNSPKYIHQMPLLVQEGMEPLSIVDILERRLNSEDDWWRRSFFHTSDAIVYSSRSDNFKISLGADFLRRVGEGSNLSKNGALILPEGFYEKVEGREFSKENLRGFLNCHLSYLQVIKSPIWNYIVRDKTILKETAKLVFKDLVNRSDLDLGMGVYISDVKGFEVEDTARVLSIAEFGRVTKARVSGTSSFNYPRSRLMGRLESVA